jgi:radical SAM superfamily enzyme YgiQ (UPF0313 family)
MQVENQSLDVLIINSPLFRDKVNEYDEDYLPPLGLGYIATDLLSNGMTVELLDAVAENMPLSVILTTIQQKKPYYVAMNIFTTNLKLVREIVESTTCKTHFIIGGLATKELYQTILRWNISCPVDIVIGEGDFIISAIVQKKPISVLCQDGNKRVISITVTSPYFPHDISNIPLDRSFFINQPLRNALGLGEVSIITSRGCIYNCAFCSAAKSQNRGTPIRERNTQSVAIEVATLCELYQDITSVRILDDLFLRNTESVDRAVKIFGNVPVTWRAMAHVLSFHKLSDRQLLELKRSGCVEVFVGIESGSPHILKMIHKTSDTTLIKRTVERLFRVGINVKGYFIFGFETETIEDMQMSFDLAAQLKDLSLRNHANFRVSVFQFRPYHGTELYHELTMKGGSIDEIVYQDDLTADIGRKQFNFTSGNFSAVSDDDLHKFIIKTNAINQ